VEGLGVDGVAGKARNDRVGGHSLGEEHGN
jgi:hypothetical protein